MNRDMRKLVKDYERRFGDTGTREGDIYASDIMQVGDMAMERRSDAFYFGILYALEAGFMMGYRKWQRDERSKRKPIAQ